MNFSPIFLHEIILLPWLGYCCSPLVESLRKPQILNTFQVLPLPPFYPRSRFQLHLKGAIHSSENTDVQRTWIRICFQLMVFDSDSNQPSTHCTIHAAVQVYNLITNLDRVDWHYSSFRKVLRFHIQGKSAVLW